VSQGVLCLVTQSILVVDARLQNISKYWVSCPSRLGVVEGIQHAETLQGRLLYAVEMRVPYPAASKIVAQRR